MEIQWISNSQNNPEKEEQNQRTHASDFKADYKAIVIKTL